MNSKLIIRLIDVALIILLGFIAISKLKTKYIELPSGENRQELNLKVQEASLLIYKDYFDLKNMNIRWKCSTLEELENKLIEKNNEAIKKDSKLIVSIETNKSCLMQQLVDVLDICQRHNIEKKLNYEYFK